jgi:hypothetical protein
MSVTLTTAYAHTESEQNFLPSPIMSAELRPSLTPGEGESGPQLRLDRKVSNYLFFVLRAAFGFAAAFERVAFFAVFFLRAVIGMRD